MRAATAVRRVALGATTRTGSVTLIAVCGITFSRNSLVVTT